MSICRISWALKDENDRQRAETIGAIVYVNGVICGQPLTPKTLQERIMPAVAMDQVKIIYDQKRHRPVGYVTWAFVAPDVEQRLLQDRDAPLHLSEWNEDGNLWIMNLVAPGYCREITCSLRYELFAVSQPGRWLRGRGAAGQANVRIWTRRVAGQG